MFQFSRFAHFATSLQLVRFPHSEITGSIHICWSPVLIAAYHVLLRLWEPRHPPCTLSYFLLLLPLLLGRVCFYFEIISCHSLLVSSHCWLQTPNCKLKTSLLLSSLSIYFFQYVKERSIRFEYRDLSIEMTCACLISHIYYLTSYLVENNGFEPLTPCVQGRCSSQLS